MRRSLLVTAGVASVLVVGATTAAAALPAGTWGGAVTATDGETATVGFSTQIAQDPGLQLQWADYLTSLVHGAELATITVVLEPLRQVQGTCARSALACYLRDSKTLFAPADDVPGQATATSIVAHEYGHHVANSETNAPWPALEDIQSPWTGPTLVTKTDTIGKAAKLTRKTYAFATPLDGTIALSVKSPRTGLYRAATATTTVCGQRSVKVTVTRVRGYGTFTLTLSRP